MSFFFSFLSSLVFLQIERERESIYLGIGRNSLNVYLYLSDGFLWRIFPLLWANGLYVIFSFGLKVWLPLVQDTFRLPPVISAVVSRYLITSTTVPQIPVLVLHSEFGIRSIHRELCPKTDFLIPFFRWRKKGAISALGFISLFLPFPGDSLGLLSLSPEWGYRVQIAWPTFFSSFNGQPKLTYIHYLLFNGQTLANSDTEG